MKCDECIGKRHDTCEETYEWWDSSWGRFSGGTEDCECPCRRLKNASSDNSPN